MYKPTKGEIRLALDLYKDFGPEHKKEDRPQLVKDLFHFDVPVEQIESIAPFKQILFRRVISGVKNVANGTAQIKTTRVKRNHS